MLNLLRKKPTRKQEGAGLYEALVSRARQPVFFRDFAVADTIDGRFDLVVLHAWLALAALKAQDLGQEAQGLTDAIFTGFDEAMREQGAGDMGLGRKMKAFADAFYGRLAAYEAARDEAELAAALARNLYRGAVVDARAQALAAYALRASGALKQSLPQSLDFGPLPVLLTAMTDPLPLSHSYNLARLGNAGDTVTFDADEAQRAAIAAWSGVLAVDSLSVTVTLAKLGPVQFGLDFRVVADLAQACVVTLEPVPAHIDHKFYRELHFTGPVRRKAVAESPAEVVLDNDPEEGPEEIESLHYDLAAPALEEYVLSLEPYPRCPGVEFTPPDDGLPPPENPFAVLKGLKSGL